MPLSPRFIRLLWLPLLLLALGFLVWSHSARARRVGQVSALPGWSLEVPKADASSPTGWEHGRRQLILLQPFAESYQWLSQTQHMLASGDLRVRQVSQENTPHGRASSTPSAYRWWLGSLAWVDAQLNGVSTGRAVERSALYANPLLQVLLLAGGCWVLWRRLGPASSALFALGVVFLYPLATHFVPGQPSSRGLELVFLFWSLLPPVLLAMEGLGRLGGSAASQGWSPLVWMSLAGLAASAGLWVNLPVQLVAILGLVLGAGLSSGPLKDAGSALLRPAVWRAWGAGLTAGCLGWYFADYYPSTSKPGLETLHPLHALAFLGLGECLAQVLPSLAERKAPRGLLNWCFLIGALAMVAVLPVSLLIQGSGLRLPADLGSARLSELPGSVIAPSFRAWLKSSGPGAVFWTTVLPLFLVVPLFVGLWRASAPRAAALALTLGPVLTLGWLASAQLSHVAALDLVLLLGLVTLLALAKGETPVARHWVAAIAALLVLAPGLRLLLPQGLDKPATDLIESEPLAILERDLSHWLSARAAPGEVRVLASPDLCSTLAYYGGVQVLGTLSAENQDGYSATLRIVRAGTPEEAAALLRQRGITHLVFPSWNRFLEEQAGNGANLPAGSFLGRLRRWDLPAWLSPVSYQIPESSGATGQAVTVLKLVEDQEESLALARLAEHFADSAMQAEATAIQARLRQYPGELGVLVALARVQALLGDKAGLTSTLNSLQALLGTGLETEMPWDRRFSLAVVLTLARKTEKARQLLTGCLQDLNEETLRELNPASLLRLLAMAKVLKVEFPEPRLRAQAVSLLPPGLRSKV